MGYDAVTFLTGLYRTGDWLSPDDLPEDWRTDYEERAGIMEYCGGMPRERAEAKAMEDIQRQMKKQGIYCTLG